MKKIVIPTAVAFAAIISVIVIVQGQRKNKTALTSDVEKVSIISQRYDAAKGGLGEAVYQLKNEADVPIVAITFESEDRQSRFHRIATIDGNNERKVVALPQTTFEIGVMLDPDTSYNHIVAVVYADGTVSGREDAAKYLQQKWDEAYKEAGERLQRNDQTDSCRHRYINLSYHTPLGLPFVGLTIGFSPLRSYLNRSVAIRIDRTSISTSV